MTPADRDWDVLLLGGTSGAGKTRLAYDLSRHFGVSVFQIDDLQVALERLTGPDEQPELHFWRTNWAEFSAFSDTEFVEHFVAIAKRVFEPALESVIAEHLESGYPVIIEGDFLLPTLTTKSTFVDQDNGGRVRAIFVYEDDERQIAANYADRESGGQEFRAHASWLNGQWLRGQCQSLSVPELASRPWDTVVARALSAISAS